MPLVEGWKMAWVVTDWINEACGMEGRKLPKLCGAEVNA